MFNFNGNNMQDGFDLFILNEIAEDAEKERERRQLDWEIDRILEDDEYEDDGYDE